MPDMPPPPARTPEHLEFQPADEVLSFGEFELDPRRQELARDGRPVALNAQPLKVLAFLASHADEVVTREALQRHVWGDVLVEYDQGINACIRQIRAALNDNADEPRFIRTLRGIGYRFVAPVRRGTRTSATVTKPQRAGSGRWIGALAAGIGIAAVGVWVVLRPSDLAPVAAESTHGESEALRQEALQLLRRAIHGPSLDSARQLLNRSTRLSYSSAPPIADWSIALAFAHRATANDSASRMALRMLGRAQALDPLGVETTLAAGYADLFIRHQADSAVAHFRRAVDADSTRMFSWLGLGLAWREQGEWAHAIDALSRAARLDTASELAATELGDALFHLRRFQDAHAVVSRVTVDTTSGLLALLRANLAVVRGSMAAARSALDAAAPLTRDSLLDRDPVLARVLSIPRQGPPSRPIDVLIADTLSASFSSRDLGRRQIALAEGLLRARRLDEALDRLAWLLAVPSPLNVELVRRDPLWAVARRTPRFAELERLWSR
jgi:DNA-binding winged helix-turn-helix (wHTH) protein/Flp pilus assembly protein TadD